MNNHGIKATALFGTLVYASCIPIIPSNVEGVPHTQGIPYTQVDNTSIRPLKATDENPHSNTYNTTIDLEKLIAEEEEQIIVSVWNIGCEPCYKEMNELQKLYQEGILVIGLNADGTTEGVFDNDKRTKGIQDKAYEKAKKYLDKTTYPQLGSMDEQEDIREYVNKLPGFDSIVPLTLIITPTKNIDGYYLGFNEGMYYTIKERIKKE